MYFRSNYYSKFLLYVQRLLFSIYFVCNSADSVFNISRCHGIHKTQAEVAKLFRISCGTLTKRLLDFRSSPSAQLTVEQFHVHDFDAEFDPPSFNKNKVRGGICF
jgi:hypothetical protein